MKIAVQLLSASLVLVLIIGVISVSIFLSFNTIDAREKEIQQLSTISSLALSFNVENFNTQLEVWEYLYEPTEFRLEEFREHRKDFNVKLNNLFQEIERSDLVLTPENEQIVQELKSDIPTVQENWEALVNALESGRPDEEVRQIAFEVENFFQASIFNYNIEKFSKFHNERLNEKQNEIEDLLAVTRLRILVLGIIGLIVGIGLSFFTSRSISGPIKKLTETAQEIAGGNLSKKVEVTSKNEVGQLGTVFNFMTGKLRKSQDHLKKQIKELKELDRLKDDFLNNTSHELKTPLIPIKSQAQLLLSDAFGKMNVKQGESVDMILRNEEHLRRLVNDIMNVSQLSSKKMVFNFRPSELAPIIEEAVSNMVESAVERGITLLLTPVPEMPTLSLDAKRITQVIGYLLNNALKFAAKGTVTVEVTKSAKEVTIRVIDTGIGMSKKTLAKLFTPFFQAESDLARKYAGTGLGLAISRGIVEAHGGAITATSEGKGKGSTVGFSLPI